MAKSEKRKRVVVCMESRLDALKRIDKGESLKSIALSFGVGESTVGDWKKKRKDIESFCSKLDSKKALESRSTLKKPKLEKLDDALLLWFNQDRANGKPISGPIIKEKAFLLHKKMGGNEDFQASEGWLNRWKKRHGIHALSICGEKLSSDPEEASKFKTSFEKLVNEKNLSKEQIYNVDETGLYYRMLPSKTLASIKEASAPGYKKSKERVTVSLCSNATGTHKLPVMLIGKSAKPRAFKNIKSLPVHYRSSKSAWMNQQLFKDWFHSEFVPAVKKHLKSQKLPMKAALVLDNAPSHPSEEELKDGDIEAVFLPPNVTALLQPMDQGVIESVKRRYRRKLLATLFGEDGENTSVIDLLKKVNIKVLVYMIAESWSELPETTLVKSWRKILPSSQAAEEEVVSTDTEISTDDFLSTFKALEGCQDVDAEDVEQWLAVDKDLQQETLSDEDIVAAVTTDGVQDENDDDEDDIAENASLISHTDGMKALETALCYVEQQSSASPIDVMLIKKWRDYAASCRISKLRQKKVTDFF